VADWPFLAVLTEQPRFDACADLLYDGRATKSADSGALRE